MLCWSVSQAQLLLVVYLLVFVILTGYLHFIIYSIFVYSFIFFIFFLFIWWVIFCCKFYVNFLLFSHVVDDSCCTCTPLTCAVHVIPLQLGWCRRLVLFALLTAGFYVYLNNFIVVLDCIHLWYLCLTTAQHSILVTGYWVLRRLT